MPYGSRYIYVAELQIVKTSLAIIEQHSWNDKTFSNHVRRVREEMVLLRSFPYGPYLSLKGADFILGGGEVWYGDPPLLLETRRSLELLPGTYYGNFWWIS